MRRAKKSIKKNKGRINHKITLYKGIEFKSKLEVYMYQQLESIGIKPRYELESFVLQDKFKYQGHYFKNTKGKPDIHEPRTNIIQPITYKPDFVDHSLKFVIETKGVANESFPLRWKLFMKLMNDTGKGDYHLFIPRNNKQVNQVINIISKLK